MNNINYASVIFYKENRNRSIVVPITTVFTSSKDDEHINPNSLVDYQIGIKYKVYYCTCGRNCQPASKICSFYPATIIALGGK